MTPSPSRSRGDDALVGVGVALLSAATVLSALYSRTDGDLDWSNFGVGIIATLALLGLAGVGLLGVADRDTNLTLATWPAAFGALAAGLMAVVAMHGDDASPWVAGLLITGIGAGAYAVVRRPAPALAAVVGLLVLYAMVVDATTGDDGSGLIFGGAVVAAFTLVVTSVACFLPGRDVIAVTVGAGAVFFYLSMLSTLSAFGLVAGGFAASTEVSSEEELDFATSQVIDPFASLHDDMLVLLLFGLGLAAVWAVLAARTGHVGYRVLVVVLVATQVPLTIGVRGVDHPSWFGLAIAVLGVLVLGAVLVRSLGRRSEAPSAAAAAPSAPPDQP